MPGGVSHSRNKGVCYSEGTAWLAMSVAHETYLPSSIVTFELFNPLRHAKKDWPLFTVCPVDMLL